MSDRILVTGRDPAALVRAAEQACGETLPWVGPDDGLAASATVWFASSAPPRTPLVLPSLRWIHSAWAGVDHWIARPEWRDGVILTRTVADFPQRIAEYVFGTLLAALLDVPRARRQQAAGEWARWLPGTLQSRTLLIVGHGTIGTKVAAVARSLEMDVLGVRRGPVSEEERARGIENPEALPRLLPRAEVVVNLLPDTPETDSFWSANRFGLLPEGAIFLNASRGRCVDDAALLAALDQGRPARAILDVFRQEPLPPEHPFWTHPAIWITPHVAGLGTAESEGKAFGENWRRWVEGKPLLHTVERLRGY